MHTDRRCQRPLKVQKATPAQHHPNVSQPIVRTIRHAPRSTRNIASPLRLCCVKSMTTRMPLTSTPMPPLMLAVNFRSYLAWTMHFLRTFYCICLFVCQFCYHISTRVPYSMIFPFWRGDWRPRLLSVSSATSTATSSPGPGSYSPILAKRRRESENLAVNLASEILHCSMTCLLAWPKPFPCDVQTNGSCSFILCPRNYEVLRPSLAKGAPSFGRYSAREVPQEA